MIDAYEDEDSIDARLQSRFDRAMASTPRKDDSIDSDRTRPRFLSESPSESVTNRLFYDADRQRRTRMKMKMAMEQNESPRRPKISSYAKTIRRDSGDIGNRLYEQGRKQRERKIEARKRASLQNTTSTTRKRYATTGTTRSKHNNTKLGEDLYRRARASQLEKERKIAEAESVAKYNARPKLNKRSMRIASQSVRSGRDAFDRLSAPPRRTLDIDAESDLTFKPHIDEKSKSLSRRRDGGLSGTKRLERLFADESRVRKKVEKMRNRLREKELAECTFEPKFLNKSRKKIKSRTMLHRQAEWTKKRDDKIRRMREKRSIVHDEECTFTPKVAKKRSGVGRCSPSREVQGTTESIVFRLYDLLQVPQAEEQLMFALRLCDEDRTGLVTCEAFLRCLRAQHVYMSLDHEVILVELLKEVINDGGEGGDEEWISYIDLRLRIEQLRDKLKEKQTQKLKDVETLHPGIDRFLKRQVKARELQKQKREIPHCDGKSWTGKLTKARAPKLHESKRRFKTMDFFSSKSSVKKNNNKNSHRRYARDVEKLLRRNDGNELKNKKEREERPTISSDRIVKGVENLQIHETKGATVIVESPVPPPPPVVVSTTQRDMSTTDRVERWAKRIYENRKTNDDVATQQTQQHGGKIEEETREGARFTRVIEEPSRKPTTTFYPKSYTRRAESDFDRRLKAIRESMQK